MGKLLNLFGRALTEHELRCLREESLKPAPVRLAPPGATQPNVILLTPSLEDVGRFILKYAPATAQSVGLVARGAPASTCAAKSALSETPQVEPGRYDLIYFDGDGAELGRTGFDYVTVWS